MSVAARQAERLELLLGDAHDRENPFGFAAACAASERAEFPEAFRQLVADEASLHMSFVPGRAGGTAGTFDQTMMAVRVCARRDLAVMPASMFSITAMTCLLLAGTDEQIATGVAIVRDGGAIGFALSEPDHGADVLAGTCALERQAQGWVLSGSKWMVGLGSRCEAAYVVARTGGRGPAAFSGVLVDAATLRAGRAGRTETSGMRGIDFARLSFDSAPVGDEALVGPVGRGMETAVRALQLVRVIGTSANVACTDTIIRSVYEHVASREIGGQPMLAHGRVAQAVGTATAFHIAADIAVRWAGRALHVTPRAQAPLSAIAKRFACEATAEIITRCGDVLGTRSVAHDGVGALFVKVRRDAEVLRYVDTGPEATRRTLSTHLLALLGPGEPTGCRTRVQSIADIEAPLPPWEPTELRIASRDPAEALVALSSSAAQVREALPGESAGLVGEVLAEIDALRAAVHDGRQSTVELADRFAAVHTAALCLLFWFHNRTRPLYNRPPGEARWVGPAVEVCLALGRGTVLNLPVADASAVSELGADLVRDNALLTAEKVRLGGHAAQARGREA